MSKTTHYKIKNLILELIEAGATPPDIERELQDRLPDHLYDAIPSLRTIQRYYKEFRSKRSENWKITDCSNPEDARLVLDALAELSAWYEHYRRPRISTELADLIIRVSKIAPDFPITAKVKIAFMLLLNEHTDEVYDLLAYLPHREGNYRRYSYHCNRAYDNFEAHAIFKRVCYEDSSQHLKHLDVWDFDLSFTLENPPEWLKDKKPFYDLCEGMAHPDWPGAVYIEFYDDTQRDIRTLYNW